MNVVIERARMEDAAAMAEVHAAGLSAAYRGRTLDRVLAAPVTKPGTRVWEKWLQRSRATTLVARVDGTVVGFCTVHSIRGDEGEQAIGEIPVIAVHPSHWRRGVGRTLCVEALAEARNHGFGEVVLWVLESNERARHFYGSLGFRTDGETRVFSEGSDTSIYELRYRRDISETTVSA